MQVNSEQVQEVKQVVQQLQETRDTEHQQLLTKQQALEETVRTLQDSFARELGSNSTALQVCFHSENVNRSRLVHRRIAVQTVLVSVWIDPDSKCTYVI